MVDRTINLNFQSFNRFVYFLGLLIIHLITETSGEHLSYMTFLIGDAVSFFVFVFLYAACNTLIEI